ncbi:MAG: DUF308 domain-containing protein [Flavobacteriaceae bacterium]|jgi:hypothetical protein|nr:DUF308 domain-containing protein [Flavobacteriaceae bacterium]
MQNNYTPPPTPQQSSTPVAGIISLISGIFALVISFIPCFGTVAVFVAIVPIILGIVSITHANKNGGQKGLGIAGLCIGAVALLIGLFWGMVLAAIGAADQNSRYTIEQKMDMPRDTINEYYDGEYNYEESDSIFDNVPSTSEEGENKAL